MLPHGTISLCRRLPTATHTRIRARTISTRSGPPSAKLVTGPNWKSKYFPVRTNESPGHWSGDFIALIVFILIVFITMCDIDKIKEKGIYCVMVAGTVSVMLAALVDTLDFSLFYLFIPIAAGLSKIYNGNMIIKVNNKNFYLFKKKG